MCLLVYFKLSITKRQYVCLHTQEKIGERDRDLDYEAKVWRGGVFPGGTACIKVPIR